MQYSTTDKQFCDRCNNDPFLTEAFENEGKKDKNGFHISYMLNLCKDCQEGGKIMPKKNKTGNKRLDCDLIG